METLERSLLSARNQSDKFEQLIGDSAALKAVLSGVECVAPTDSTVLVLGETGTGKELIARAVILSSEGVLPSPFPKFDNTTADPICGVFTDSQRGLIVRALQTAGWRVGGNRGAADRLGLKRTTVIAKMKKLEISRTTAQNNTYTPAEPRKTVKMLSGDRARFYANVIALCLALFAGAPLHGQSQLTAASEGTVPYGAAILTGRDTLSSDSQSQNPYSGGVPAGTAISTPLSLTLEESVARGLRQNLGGLLATDAVSGAQGDRWRALSALLPNLTTATSFSVHQIDLKADIGLNFPGVAHVIGPFGAFDTRASLEQPVFNWESIERARSSAAQVRSVRYGYKNARELIVLGVVSNYLLVIADQSEVESALAQRDTAKALLAQTTDQHKAGLAAAVDVLRSDVELQARELRLIVARNNLAKQKLVLARAIGLPAGQTFNVTTEVEYQPLTTSSLDEALQQAYTTRPDFKSLTEQARAAELQKKAAAAERYPTVAAAADYGDIGPNPGTSHATVDAEAALRFPIFQGGRVHGDKLVADSLLASVKQRLEDLRASIDQEVRDAFLDLQDTAQEVSVEKNAVLLATQSLQQSRDRFASGVTDYIEVVQAQESLADANDAYIASLYRYNTAKISLARAVGVAESNYALYLKGK